MLQVAGVPVCPLTDWVNYTDRLCCTSGRRVCTKQMAGWLVSQLWARVLRSQEQVDARSTCYGYCTRFRINDQGASSRHRYRPAECCMALSASMLACSLSSAAATCWRDSSAALASLASQSLARLLASCRSVHKFALSQEKRPCCSLLMTC
jgi:hypothetical protein